MKNIYYRSLRDDYIKEIPSTKRGSLVNIVTHDTEEAVGYAKEFKLDEDLVKDGIDLYEAPRIEREGNDIYIYIRYCSVEGNLTSTEPLLIVNSSENVITVTRKLSEPMSKLLVDENTITTQKVKLILQILDQVNRGYRSYINKVTKQIFSTRRRLQNTIINNDDVIVFIDIEEDLNEFLAALQPYGILLTALLSGKYVKLHEEDKDLIEDLVLSTNELIDLTKSRLKTMQNIREAYTTIATNNLNKIFKRLTSINIFLMIPTIISGLYGMNVALPLKDNPQAFSLVLLFCAAIITSAVIVFKRKRWL